MRIRNKRVTVNKEGLTGVAFVGVVLAIVYAVGRIAFYISLGTMDVGDPIVATGLYFLMGTVSILMIAVVSFAIIFVCVVIFKICFNVEEVDDE